MTGFAGSVPNLYKEIEAKTADYTLVPGDVGKVFTTRGATAAVNFTLPDSGEIQAGWNAMFYSAADVNMTVTADIADTMVTLNDLAADSVALSTSSEKIGGAFEVIWDGTGWLTISHPASSHAQTVTVATA